MDYIKLKWNQNGDNISINADDIVKIIEIDLQNKELKNVKEFFREIIFYNYYNDLEKEIILINDENIEVPEIALILNELIDICNKEISNRKKMLKVKENEAEIGI